MGLIITSTIDTDAGSTSTAYINILKFDIAKESGARVFVNLYLSQAARDANSQDTISSRSILRRFGVSSEDLDLSNIYASLYAKLKTKLEDSGLTVIDEI
jgi:hypothetical protein